MDWFLVAIDSHDDGTSGLWSPADGTSWRALPAPTEAGPGSTLWEVAIGTGAAVLVGQVEALDASVAVLAP